MDKIELYYDHYKETFNLSKKAQIQRNKLFIWLCVLETFSFLMVVNPEKTVETFISGINTHFEINFLFGNTTVQTLLWILIAYTTVRYCQDVLYIERQYFYLYKIEEKISQESNTTIFNREGEEYLKKYPIVLNFIDLFYKMFCPMLFMSVNIVRIVQEWKNVTSISPFSILCDTMIFINIFIITWFYFFEIHSKLTTWCKNHIPLTCTIASALRRILKEI